MGVLDGKTILVTGAGGFIGRHVARRLRDSGVKVIAWVRREVEPIPGIAYEYVDLTLWERVRDGMAGRRFDAVIHLASRGRRMADSQDVLTDLEMTAHLLEASRWGTVDRVICFGSADQYGAADPPQSVSTPTKPLSPYGLAKNLADALLEFASRWFAVIVFRPFSVYGEGQPATMFISRAIRACLRGEDLEMSHGNQLRDFIYVDDVCDAVIQGLSIEGLTGTYNLGTGQGTQIWDVAQRILAFTKAGIRIHRGRVVRADDPPALVADISETTERLRWMPKTSLDLGLQKVIANERNRV